MIPLVMWLLGECVSGADPTDPDLESRKLSFWATMVFALAAITDFLDGWVARNWNLGSTVGRFLDPLADKLIVMACLVMFVALDRCPAWLPVLALAREISVTTLRTMAMSEGLEIKVNQGGKWKTAFQLCGLIGLMVHYEYPVSWGIVTVDFNFNVIGYWLLILSMVFSMQSAWEYLRGFVVVAAEQRDTR